MQALDSFEQRIICDLMVACGSNILKPCSVVVFWSIDRTHTSRCQFPVRTERR